MTSRQLDYFSTIAECQNFSAAAKKLYVSQPAISQQIQVLEEEIGYPLIHRTRHHVELTEYGQIFEKIKRKSIHHRIVRRPVHTMVFPPASGLFRRKSGLHCFHTKSQFLRLNQSTATK